MAKRVLSDVSRRQEMAAIGEGLQPVVVMKQGNACGAKGHRRERYGYAFRLAGTPYAGKLARTV